MPFIRLRTEMASASYPSIRYLDEQGREQVVPLLRVRLGIAIGQDPAPNSLDKRRTYDAVLDTGSPLTIFPKSLWQYVAPEVTRLQMLGDRPSIARAGGRQFSYFLGRIWVGAFDPYGRRLPAVPVLAQFRQDDIPAG